MKKISRLHSGSFFKAFSAALCTLFLISCAVSTAATDEGPSGTEQSGGSGGSGTQTNSDDSDKKTDVATLNPEPYTSRSENLDFIFNPDVLGETTITISRKEWQKMLFFYDKSIVKDNPPQSDNEQYVIARKFNFSKNGQNWELNNVGLRVRGNTSLQGR